MSIEKKLPTEIIYSHILPYVPSFGLSKKILKLQKRRLSVVGRIQKLLRTNDIRLIKKDILHYYQGDLDYCYEDLNTYLYVNLRQEDDFIYLIN